LKRALCTVFTLSARGCEETKFLEDLFPKEGIGEYIYII
jgi:hypothetical protein